MWELKQYNRIIERCMTHGEKRSTRAGDAYSVFGERLQIDMEDGQFPLLMGRKMFYKPVLGELAAFFRGPKTVEDFKRFGCNYWDSWGDRPNDVSEGGHIRVDYGNAWLDFGGVNQLEVLVDKIRRAPTDRRLLVTGWRPDRLEQLSLPCCHMLYQWYVRATGHLDMIWYQRSVDVMVGLPSDIILAAAWNAILAVQTGLKPGRLTFMLGDTHVYANHLGGVLDYQRQLQAVVASGGSPANVYSVSEFATMEGFTPDMILINNYHPQPAVKFELNV